MMYDACGLRPITSLVVKGKIFRQGALWTDVKMNNDILLVLILENIHVGSNLLRVLCLFQQMFFGGSASIHLHQFNIWHHDDCNYEDNDTILMF